MTATGSASSSSREAGRPANPGRCLGGGDHRAARGQAAEVEERADAAPGFARPAGGRRGSPRRSCAPRRSHRSGRRRRRRGRAPRRRCGGRWRRGRGARPLPRGSARSAHRFDQPSSTRRRRSPGGRRDRAPLRVAPRPRASEVELARAGLQMAPISLPPRARRRSRRRSARCRGRSWRAVDRVDHPGVDGRASAGLLAEEAVGGRLPQRRPMWASTAASVSVRKSCGPSCEPPGVCRAKPGGRCSPAERRARGRSPARASRSGAAAAEVDVHGIVAARKGKSGDAASGDVVGHLVEGG